MRFIMFALLICLLMPQASSGDSPERLHDDDWYRERYKCLTLPERFFTFESEFDWPEGYRRFDSTELTPFQYWVSHFPIWHKDKAVFTNRFGKRYEAKEISRSLQFQWRVVALTDCGIPIQMLAEYYLWLGEQAKLSYVLKRGETINYAEYLTSKSAFRPGQGIVLIPDAPKEHAELQINKFVDLTVRNTTYASLAENCSPIDREEVLPGDLLIARDSAGTTGQVWVILNVIVNKKGKKLYLVGTGCADQCMFYIPLFNNNRKYPWITLKQVEELAGGHEQSGFFRLRSEFP
ncbi:MAG: hypothetical protein JSU65_12790 [Candidatus Zixiibacteriota bacterium]|nr:MAG: hypothetical protein JSU65_12790 [candidate division Zixibacteria bacterium]